MIGSGHESLAGVVGLPRDALVAALAAAFPGSTGADVAEHDAVAAARTLAFRGGRAAALEALAAIDPAAYARSRNHVGGAVTRLSPWIRHGVLSLAEVRDAALARVARVEDAEKLVSELGWRDYWRQVHASLGDRIHDAIEPPAAVRRGPPPLDALPADVPAAATGMPCIDAFVRRLHATGWLHNHERMWLASWLVHVRGVHWRAGADWFLRHLVDGDPASNHLSWQWIAGTFAAKPYVFTRENLERHTAGAHCRPCPLLGRCPVEGTVDELLAAHFLPDAPQRPPLRIRPASAWRPAADTAVRRPLVWLTLDATAATSPAAAMHPDAPTVFVVDPAWLAVERPSLLRLVFLFECLADVPGVTVHVGDPRHVLEARAAALGCDGVAVADTPCPRVRAAVAALAPALPTLVHAWPRFCDHARADDLGRFSRVWSRTKASALLPTAAGR